MFFFFKQKTAYEMRISDWGSDVCSSDLFLFAADRAHPRLAERYDWLSIAILRFLDRVVRACEDHEVPVGVCGEMGGRTLEAMALIGLGVRRLSITQIGSASGRERVCQYV